MPADEGQGSLDELATVPQPDSTNLLEDCSHLAARPVTINYHAFPANKKDAMARLAAKEAADILKSKLDCRENTINKPKFVVDRLSVNEHQMQRSSLLNAFDGNKGSSTNIIKSCNISPMNSKNLLATKMGRNIGSSFNNLLKDSRMEALNTQILTGTLPKSEAKAAFTADYTTLHKKLHRLPSENGISQFMSTQASPRIMQDSANYQKAPHTKSKVSLLRESLKTKQEVMAEQDSFMRDLPSGVDPTQLQSELPHEDATLDLILDADVSAIQQQPPGEILSRRNSQEILKLL